MFETLKMFCDVPAPGGREERIHGLLTERWAPYVASTEIDRVGNYIARVGGSGPRMVLVGHGDEIGFAVKYISPEGYVYFTTGQREATGKPTLRASYFNPMGQPALVVGRMELVRGVFATLTGHVMTTEQRAKTVLDWNDLFIDLFLGSDDVVRAAGVEIGDRAVWDVPARRFGDFFSGKAMDNRVALTIFEKLLEQIDVSRLQYELFVTSTVQEEPGLYGAESLNRSIDADYAIAVDVGLSGDVPGVDPRDVSTALGKGPILVHKDFYGYSFTLNNQIRDVATANALPLQHAVHGIYGTDSGALLRNGVAASAIGVPTRYTHSPFETVHEGDMKATVDLLLALLYTEPPQ